MVLCLGPGSSCRARFTPSLRDAPIHSILRDSPLSHFPAGFAFVPGGERMILARQELPGPEQICQ
jgi:hypothetical protein